MKSSPAKRLEKSISGRRKCKHKAPDVGTSFAHLKKSREVSWLPHGMYSSPEKPLRAMCGRTSQGCPRLEREENCGENKTTWPLNRRRVLAVWRNAPCHFQFLPVPSLKTNTLFPEVSTWVSTFCLPNVLVRILYKISLDSYFHEFERLIINILYWR